MKNRTALIKNIEELEDRIDMLQERSYSPDLSNSEVKELNKRRKKLLKNKDKLLRKLDRFELDRLSDEDWGDENA